MYSAIYFKNKSNLVVGCIIREWETKHSTTPKSKDSIYDIED